MGDRLALNAPRSERANLVTLNRWPKWCKQFNWLRAALIDALLRGFGRGKRGRAGGGGVAHGLAVAVQSN